MADQPTVRISSFEKGLISRKVRTIDYPTDALESGQDVLLAEGGVLVRPGYSLTSSSLPAGEIRALWQVIFPTNEISYLLAQVEAQTPIVWGSTDTLERSGHSLVFDQEAGTYILFGGEDSTGYNNDTWSYDPLTNTWTEITTSGTPPSARIDHTAVCNPADGCMYVFGGEDMADYTADCFKFDLDTSTWSEVTLSGSVPAKRSQHIAVLISSAVMMVCGGYYGSADRPGGTYYDINLSTGVCTETEGTISPDPPPYFHGRRLHASAYDGSRYVYVMGGVINSEFGENDLWRLDRNAGTWTRLTSCGERTEADAPETGFHGHTMHYCSGYLIAIGGSFWGSDYWDYNEAYKVYDITGDEWITVLPDGDLGTRAFHASAISDTGNIFVHGGSGQGVEFLSSGYIATALCTADGAAEAARWTYGLYASNTHLPTTSAAFESVMDLTADSGVMTWAVLGDRLIVTEGVSHVPHVLLPGTLTTDPVSSWAQPMRVLVTYDGTLENVHDISNYVLDNDLDSYADIGGVTTSGAILICCDVPTIEGIYFEFETPSNAEGAIRQFSATSLMNTADNISQGNWKGNVSAWFNDGTNAGHFEGAPHALSASAATNVGGGIVGIPCPGHPFVAGNTVTLHGTVNYDDAYVLPDQTGSGADVFYITATYVAETFNEEQFAGLNVGTDLYLEAGQKIFTTRHLNGAIESAAIVEIDGDGTTLASVILTNNVADGDVTGVYGLRIVTAGDISQVSLTRTDDTTVTLMEKTLNSVQLLRYELPTGFDVAPASYRFVIPATDMEPAAIACEYLRFTISPGILSYHLYQNTSGGLVNLGTPSQTVTIQGVFLSSCSFARRHGESSYGHPDNGAPTLITFGGSSSIETIASTLTTDWITFPFDPVNDHLFHVEVYDDSSVQAESKGPDDPHIVYTKLAQGYTLSREFDANYSNTRSDLMVTKIEGLVTARFPLGMYPCVSTDRVIVDGVPTGSQIELYGSDSIESIVIVCDIPGVSAAYFACSFDGRYSFHVYDTSLPGWRMIAKLAAIGTWQYNSAASGEETWNDTSSADPWLALQAAFLIAQNQMTPTEAQAITQEQWFEKTGAEKFDFALGLQADQTAPNHDIAPSVLSVNVNTTNKGGSAITAYRNNTWTNVGAWTNNTLVGDISFAQDGTIIPNNGTATATYGVIAGVPGYWFRAMMRGTAPGTTLTKVRYKAPCQALQNIGNGRPDTPLGVVFHDNSEGLIHNFSVKMADFSNTEIGSAVVPAEADDAVYIGYITPFNEIELIYGEDNNSEISVATYSYWNGLEYVSLSATDGTLESGMCWRRRGKVKFAIPNDWRQHVPLQGLSFFDEEVGGKMRLGYWVRVTFSGALTATTQLAEVRVSPVPNAVVKHTGAAVFRNRLALWGRPDAPGQVDISRETQEYGLTGWDSYSYNTQYQIISGVSAWDTLLLAGATEWNLLRTLNPQQGIVFEVAEAARHLPLSTRVIAKAPLPGQDGGVYGLYYINRYGAFCQTGLTTDSTYGTSRVANLSEMVAWWDDKSVPRLDLNHLDIACSVYFPEKNLVLFSVPMIVDYPVDIAAVVQEMSTDPTPVPTGRVKVLATNHGRSVGEVIRITGTRYLNGEHTLHANTTNNYLVFTATYKAETLTPCARYSVSGEEQTTNNRILAFDINLRAWLPPLNMACSSLCSAYHYLATAPGKLGQLGIYAGLYNGTVCRIFDPTATQDLSTNILAWAETGWVHFGNPETDLMLQELWVWGASTVTNGVRLTVGTRFYQTGATRDVYNSVVLSDLTNPGRDIGMAAHDPDISGNLMKIRLDLIGPAEIRGIQLGLPDNREGALIR